MKVRDYLYRSYLEEGEEIIFVIHRHLSMQTMDFVKIFFFGLFVPLVAWWLFPEITIFAILWMVMGVSRFIHEFFDWYYDVWLVTTAGIIQIFWKGMFEKTSSRTAYHIILEVGYEIKGVAPTLFGYGTLVLELATGNAATFEGAVNPKKKAEMLTKAKEDFVTSKSFRDHRVLQTVLSDLLQHHITQHGLPHENDDLPMT